MNRIPCELGLWAASTLLVASGCCLGQTLKIRTPGEPTAEDASAKPAPPAPLSVDMKVPAGTPIKVTLDGKQFYATNPTGALRIVHFHI